MEWRGWRTTTTDEIADSAYTQPQQTLSAPF
jgi:hypothetical protein